MARTRALAREFEPDPISRRRRRSFTAAKRERSLQDRGLDFEDAPEVFRGLTLEVDDLRKDYGERRVICLGMLQGRLVVVGYAPRGSSRHIFSMRKANGREKARLAPYFKV
ncbi:MAG: BrnT family toxin [Gammaproteobacteria bacterium]|nr:BrnT family toxin [Gammaproteobacteria bacterium]MBI5616789.1 BrnT family toxin [Gammaproteobacteria bacterium]